MYTETPAERLFRESQPITHLYTTPLESDVFYQTPEEKDLALLYLAIATKSSGCQLLAYSLMSNHFHFILIGSEEMVEHFWRLLERLLTLYFQRHGRPGLMKQVHASKTPITSLSQLRAEIAYVIRNAFVVQRDVHVFADPSSSGFLYFNPLLVKEGVSASTIKGRKLRTLTCSRSIESLESSIYIKDGKVQPWSFVDYKLAEAFYDDARQFVHSVLKNVEAQVETALRYGEKPFLSDDELRPIVFSLCRDQFKAEKPEAMDFQDRKRLGVTLKNRYSASNKQIARLAKLSLNDVNALFPLSAKQQP